jgi:hypothetical protein
MRSLAGFDVAGVIHLRAMFAVAAIGATNLPVRKCGLEPADTLS